jgi:hypothetical protein
MELDHIISYHGLETKENRGAYAPYADALIPHRNVDMRAMTKRSAKADQIRKKSINH